MKKRVLSIALAAIMAISLLPLASMAEGLKPLVAPDLTKPVGYDLSGMNTTDTHGNPVTADLFRSNEITVLNTWATWCVPCKAEMPHFQTFSEKYDGKGINMVGMVFEINGCTADAANAYLDKEGLTYLNLRMDTLLSQLLYKDYGATPGVGVPITYLVDRNCTVVAAKYGAMQSVAELEDWVFTYYKEPVLETFDITENVEVASGRMVGLEFEYTPWYIENTAGVNITWTSSDESIAKVNKYGVVTGVSKGTATITAACTAADKTLEDTCTVTVKESAPLTEGTEYFKKTDKISADTAYAVVVKYDDNYYAMSPELMVDGVVRMMGTKIAPEAIMTAATKDGEIDINLLKLDNENMWMFSTGEGGGYSVSNMKTGEYLNTRRNNGIYRVALGSEPKVFWQFEDGMLKIVKGTYSDARQYMSFYEDKGVLAFDLMDAEDKAFTDVMIYERAIFGVEPQEDLKGDLNANGYIDAGDATIILRNVVGDYPLTEEQAELADMNENGRVDCGDAGLVLRLVI